MDIKLRVNNFLSFLPAKPSAKCIGVEDLVWHQQPWLYIVLEQLHEVVLVDKNFVRCVRVSRSVGRRSEHT